MTPADVLVRAAILIIFHDWWDGSGKKGERHCLYTAIMDASNNSAPARQAALEAIHNKIGPPVNWNDAPGRTKREVFALLFNTAVELESK